MKILDTSVYVSAFLDNDSNHEEWLRILSDINEKIILHYLIFQEILTILTYKHSKELAEKFSDFILEDSRFVIINWEIMEELNFWKELDKKVSYIDIIVIYTAIKYKIDLISFDLDMNKIYKNLI